MEKKRISRGPLIAGLVAVVLLLSLAGSLFGGGGTTKLSDVQAKIAMGTSVVKSAEVHDPDEYVVIKTVDGKTEKAYFQDLQGVQVVNAINANNIPLEIKKDKGNPVLSLLVNFLPIVFILVLFFFVMNQMQGGGGRVMSFGKSKAKLVSKDTPKTLFADVAGADEAIEELQEIKEFLESPAKFQAIGAKIPKGVLLYGPPGTGKTLLARAVAGEAGVPFYSISGSDFVEMFVGVGASRVRDLFEQAKANAPSIIFIDEIDAVGRHRGAGMGGGHDEREQTLNQMLVEMDGFDVKGGVILIAATNRPDILDPALLRPGRFDRQIAVDRPDLLGREAILKVHAKGKPFADDVDLSVIARRTPGFTGADLANVLNESALLTARHGGDRISMHNVEEAIDRVMAGPERKGRVMSDREKKIIAYHEGGHALVAHALANTDPVHKITILPRGRALGYTMQLPTEDKFLRTRSEMVDELSVLLGGRTAEEVVFHEPTTGASNDIERATAVCKAMITEYGMSDSLGARTFGHAPGEPFMGMGGGGGKDYSEELAREIDEQVSALIEAAHDVSWEIVVEYRDVLDDLVLQLMEKETLTKDQVLAVFEPIVKRPREGSYTGVGKREPSTRPPVLTPAELEHLSADQADAMARGTGAGRGARTPLTKGRPGAPARPPLAPRRAPVARSEAADSPRAPRVRMAKDEGQAPAARRQKPATDQ